MTNGKITDFLAEPARFKQKQENTNREKFEQILEKEKQEYQKTCGPSKQKEGEQIEEPFAYGPANPSSLLKICSFNINGIRASQRKGLRGYLLDEAADIYIFGETKIDDTALPKFYETMGTTEKGFLPGYSSVFYNNCKRKKGYSGVGVFVRDGITEKLGKFVTVHMDLGNKFWDNEGRLVLLEWEKLQVVGTYTPNAGSGLARLRERMEWDVLFRKFLIEKAKSKPIIWLGDANVAPTAVDIARPDSNLRSPGFTEEERTEFELHLKSGFFDLFRHLYPDKKDCYSWWSVRTGARARNIGWRIDHAVGTERIRDATTEVMYRTSVKLSDHCPLICCIDTTQL